MVVNVHQRTLNAPILKLAPMIDQFASSQDHFWPYDRWPRVQFDRPLSVGAVGGHGTIGYFVEQYHPGREIVFRFTAPQGLNGTHQLILEDLPDGKTRVKHVVEASLEGKMMWMWPLMIRFLHDALVEDGMDRAEAWFERRVLKPRAFSPWVKTLRWVMAKSRARVARTRTRTGQIARE